MNSKQWTWKKLKHFTALLLIGLLPTTVLAYVAFSNSGIEGGFEKTEEPIKNGALIILYYKELIQIKKRIIAASGTITKEIFSFPGGHRFHFMDPSKNELAVWSDLH